MHTVDSPATHAGPSSSDVEITVYPADQGVAVAHGERERFASFEELIASMREPPQERPADKERGEKWSPATFRGDHRTKDNLERAFMVGFDVDTVPIPATVADLVRAAGPWRGFVHTSWSHLHMWKGNEGGTPRYRLALLLSRPVTSAEEYARVWRWVEKQIAPTFGVGQGAKDCSRYWNVPCQNADGSYIFEELTGALVDVERALLEEPAEQAKSRTELSTPSATSRRDDLEMAAIQMGKVFAKAAPTGGHEGKRDVLSMAMAGACAHGALSREDAVWFCSEVARRGGNEEPEKRATHVDKARAKMAAGEQVSGWTTILEIASSLPGASKIAEDARDFFTGTRADRGIGSRLADKQRAKAVAPPAVAANTNAPTFLERLNVRVGGWDEPLEEPVYTVDRVLPQGAVAMFYAHGDSLKTWAAFSMAHAVATGTKWLGKVPTKKGRALVLDFEMGEYETKRRAKLLKIGEAPDLLHASYPDFRIDDEALWFGLDELGLSLVVVDSLAAGATGVDENDAKAAAPLHHARKYAERTGAAVVIIHHSNKGDGKDRRTAVRGTSAIFAALDGAFDFEAISDDGSTKVMKLNCTKMRRGKKPPSFMIRLSDAKGLEWFEADDTARAPKGQELDIFGAVRLCIAQHGPDVPSGVARKLGRRADDVRKAMAEMTEGGSLAVIKRKHHLDGEKERERRILDALAGNHQSASKLARAADVKTADVVELETKGLIMKTSDGYASTSRSTSR